MSFRYSGMYRVVLSVIGFCFIFHLATAQINSFPYFEDFETTNGGWSSQNLSGVYNNWVWDSPMNPVINSAASGTRCWILGNSPIVFNPLHPYYYGPDERSAAVSPEFDFSALANPGIKMNIWWNSQFSVDGTVLQSSIDNGATWQTVGDYLDPDNWYNDSSISALPGGGVVGWTGDTATSQTGSGGWVEAQHPLTGLAGEASVLLRFAFASDGGVDSAVSVFDGFAFDDILIADLPVFELGNDTILCFADSLILEACDPGAASYQWNTSPLDTLCDLVAVSTARYIVTMTDTLGFFIRDTIRVTVSSTFVNLGPDQIICPGDTVTLNAFNPNATYLWEPTLATTPAIDVFSTGEYKVTAIDNFNCIESDSINIVVDFVPVVDLGPDTNICAGGSIQLDAGAGNPGTTYDWDPITATTQTLFISAPGTYSVLVTTQANCTETDTVTIGVGLTPLVDLGPDGIFCDSIRLNASNPGASYFWSTTDTTQRITVSSSGAYSVTVTDPSGCNSADTIMLTQSTGTPFSLGPDPIICGGGTVSLDIGVPGQRYFWSNGDTTQSTNISFAGPVIATLINGDGCESKDTVTIARSTLGLELGADRSICDGDSVLLTAGPNGETYLWSTNETTQSIYASLAGDYTVTKTDSIGCSLSDTVTVSVTPSPTPAFGITGDKVLFSNLSFSDQSTGSVISWFWDFGDGTTSTQPNPTHAYASIDSFDVCLTVDDGTCTRTTCETIFIDVFSGIYGYHPGIELLVYPNPSQDFTQVELTVPRESDAEVSIRDLSGKLLLRENLGYASQFNHQLDVSGLARGLYIFTVKIGNQPLHLKLEVQ